MWTGDGRNTQRTSHIVPSRLGGILGWRREAVWSRLLLVFSTTPHKGRDSSEVRLGVRSRSNVSDLFSRLLNNDESSPRPGITFSFKNRLLTIYLSARVAPLTRL